MSVQAGFMVEIVCVIPEESAERLHATHNKLLAGYKAMEYTDFGFYAGNEVVGPSSTVFFHVEKNAKEYDDAMRAAIREVGGKIYN